MNHRVWNKTPVERRRCHMVAIDIRPVEAFAVARLAANTFNMPLSGKPEQSLRRSV
jgi:hypothetical protein